MFKKQIRQIKKLAVICSLSVFALCCGEDIKKAINKDIIPNTKWEQKDTTTTQQNKGVPAWMELPLINNKDCKFYYHNMTIDNKTMRNYSYYYNKAKFTSVWVAYPLCRGNIGNKIKRTNKWGLDPNMPQDQQPVLFKGFRNNYNLWYARGHQIASADRLANYNSNAQTFYFTNMTPQLQDFNGGVWERLEDKVRTWARQSDTLYVVTGCVLQGSTKFAYDNVGKKIPIPTAYYKVLLRYRKNSTIGHKGYMGLGYYFDHTAHKKESLQDHKAMSIEEIEHKVGTKFFVNLYNKIGKEETTKVKTENPQEVNWWWN